LQRLRKLHAQALNWQTVQEDKLKTLSAGVEKNFKDFYAT